MLKKLLWVGLFFMLVFFVSLLGCPTEITQADPSQSVNLTLRAIPIASSMSVPIVLDSYVFEDCNYYLVDAGYIRNIYISTLADLYYNGMTPMSLSRTDITSNTVTKATTEIISKTITISDTKEGKVGIAGAWKKKFPVAGEFNVKLSAAWKGTLSNVDTSIRSIETSLETVDSKTTSINTLFTIGEHNEPKGWYRYSLYAVADVYFLISTSLDKQELKSWETVVCARDNSYIPFMDYSVDGIFDNSPTIGNDITFEEDFYKKFPDPDDSLAPEHPSLFYETSWQDIRSATKKITDSGRFNQHFDAVNFDRFGIDINTMRQAGYKTISFYIRLNVREIDDAYQYLMLFSSPIKSNDYLISSSVQFEHGPSYIDKNWWTHYESELKFENISIDKFIRNEFVIRYGSSGNWADDWENKDLQIQLLFRK